jgi:ParB/RepB/Spo0J family partition protein
MEVIQIPWDDLRPDPNQPRQSFEPELLEALEASFRLHGQVTPARVRPDPGGPTPFVLVDGERRWRVGKKLHTAEPDNPLFASFKAFVADVDKDDLLVVQFLSNTSAEHTPLEKAQVFRRLTESKLPRNKLRATMAIPKRQFRQVREFASAPAWLHAYGEPQRRRVPVVDELGRPKRDELGALVTEDKLLPALPLSHLEVLARYARRFVDWDKEQQAAHPDGEHINVAQRAVCSIADKAQRDSWTAERITKRCIASWESVTTAPMTCVPAAAAAEEAAPFTRTAKGGLRVPTLDPEKLSDDARKALVVELRRVAEELEVGAAARQAARTADAELAGAL